MWLQAREGVVLSRAGAMTESCQSHLSAPQAWEMTELVGGFPIKAEDLRSIPRSHTVERKNILLQVDF